MMTFKEQYYKIIQHRQANPLEDGVFGEIHHIYPKSLFPQFENSDWNLVKLTPQEHYDCHELLVKWFEEDGDKNGYEKMVYAWNRINNSRDGIVINAEQYAEMKERFAAMCSERMKGENNSMFGKNAFEGKTEEEMAIIKQKMSEARKGKKRSDDTKKKIGEARKGKNKGKNNPRYKPFTIDNNRYETLDEATKHFGVCCMTISNWLNGKRKTSHDCKYIEKETVNG